MSTANVAAEDSLIGSRIDGRYTVHRVLGQGGMGVVYEGVHDELGRSVAIKVLNAAWAADRTAVERFLREARTASSFSHSNIVDVSDLGRLADGRPYLVMPKVSGVDLATLLAENGPQPAKRVANLLAGVASALDLVHSKGYVHRDIKPENLMYIVRDDGTETVMLLDFGIAAAVMSSGPRLTRQGAIFGTPHYLPPEVCAGSRCDARGDVYSLAAVAFELITGDLPFAADDIMQLMAQKVSYDAPSLAAISGSKFPAELEKVIATGLARDPRYRFSSASAFISALRVATQSAPVSWKTGVVRPSRVSAEHTLPKSTGGRGGQGGHSGWEAERAPTWPVRTEGSGGYDDVPPPSPRPPRSTAPRYEDESSTVRRGFGGRSPAASPYPPPTMNPGVWGPHATPNGHDTYASRSLQTDYTSRYPDGGYTHSARKRSSLLPVLVGVAAIGALGMGGVQLVMSRRGNPQTDASASTVTRGVTPEKLVAPTVPATSPKKASSPAAAVTRPVAPAQHPTSPTSPTSLPASAPSEPAPLTPNAQAESPAGKPTTRPAPRSGAELSGADVSAAAKPLEVPTTAAPPSAVIGPAPTGSATRQPTAPSVHLPRAAPPSPEEAAAEPAEPVNPATPAAAPTVITVTPIAPSTEVKPPEPEPAPQADSASAADYAKQSSAALLRGEVTRAIDLARRATQADPGYAIAWRSLGLALERAGASERAIEAYNEYLQRAPSGPQADMVRERIQSLGH